MPGKTAPAARNPAAVSPYVSAAPTTQVKEASRPDADFRVEGVVAQMGKGRPQRPGG